MKAVGESAETACDPGDADHADDAGAGMNAVAESGETDGCGMNTVAASVSAGLDAAAGGGGIADDGKSAVRSSGETGSGDVADCGKKPVRSSAETAEGDVDGGGVNTAAAVNRPAELPHARQVASVSGDSLPQSGQSMNTS